MVTGIAGAEDESSPDTTPVSTATATPTPTATPAGPPPPPAGLDPTDRPDHSDKHLPPGPIASDRAIVYTGDGDCLNVRPVPSTQFESDPRFCLHEGEVVYLYGDVVEADGEQWRYALGRGWLATQYVRMEPREFDDRLGGFDSVFLLDATNDWPGSTGGARMSADGRLERIPDIREPNGQPGEGLRFSPDGDWLAYTLSGPMPLLRIVDLRSGEKRSIDDAAAISWSDDGKLLLSAGGCDATSCKRGAAWMYPWDESPTALSEAIEEYQDLVWAPDGESVVGTVAGKQVVRYWLDGTSETLVEQVAEDVWLGELTVSPDGRSLLAGGIAAHSVSSTSRAAPSASSSARLSPSRRGTAAVARSASSPTGWPEGASSTTSPSPRRAATASPSATCGPAAARSSRSGTSPTWTPLAPTSSRSRASNR